MGNEEPVVGVGQRGGTRRPGSLVLCTCSGHADRSGADLELEPRNSAELAPVLLGLPLLADR